MSNVTFLGISFTQFIGGAILAIALLASAIVVLFAWLDSRHLQKLRRMRKQADRQRDAAHPLTTTNGHE
jgi:hypothetical protein